jgi:hypothetical protein
MREGYGHWFLVRSGTANSYVKAEHKAVIGSPFVVLKPI